MAGSLFFHENRCFKRKRIRFNQQRSVHTVSLQSLYPNFLQSAATYQAPYRPSSFKDAAILANQEGQTPMATFLQAGIHIEMIGRDMPKKC